MRRRIGSFFVAWVGCPAYAARATGCDPEPKFDLLADELPDASRSLSVEGKDRNPKNAIHCVACPASVLDFQSRS